MTRNLFKEMLLQGPGNIYSRREEECFKQSELGNKGYTTQSSHHLMRMVVVFTHLVKCSSLVYVFSSLLNRKTLVCM